MSAADRPKIRPIRRVVTGHDAAGRSVVRSDAPSPHVMTLPGAPTFGVTDLWKTLDSPASNAVDAEPCSLPITLAPPPRGSVVRVVEFPPDRDYLRSWKREEAFAGLGESGSAALDADASRHPMMHTTASVDYAIVLQGEISAVLDLDEVVLQAGDVLIQRGTNHAWSNRTEQPCLVAFVLIDAHPLADER